MAETISTNNALELLVDEAKIELFSNEEVNKWQQILSQLLITGERLPYSQLTYAIYNVYDSEQLENVQDNFSKVMDVTTQWDLDEYETITEQLKKIEDHIKLAITQRLFILSNVYELDTKLNEKEEELNQFKEKLSKAEDELYYLKSSKTKIYTEFVTILGIFATIIFASFGGIQMLNNVLGNIQEVKAEKLLVFSSLTIAAITLLIFILLNGIARMTGLKLRSCNCGYDENCRHTLAQKHPSIAIAFLVIIYIFILGALGYFFNITTLRHLTAGVNDWFKLIIITFLLTLMAIVFLSYYKKKRLEQ